MVDSTDWRLQGQERYLKGVELRWQVYRRYPANPDWDHDHCEFCWAKFMVEDYPDVFHEGYSTLDEYRWICKGCFDDFKEMFEWRVVRSPDQ
jgi:hypothetical protein